MLLFLAYLLIMLFQAPVCMYLARGEVSPQEMLADLALCVTAYARGLRHGV